MIPKNIHKFVFDIFLDDKFPFQQPQILCRTDFSVQPSTDGRDIFQEILKSDWKIANKLYEIVQYIPEFIQEVIIEEEESMKVIGRFHLGNRYNLNDWEPGMVNLNCSLFPCEEQDEGDPEYFYPRVIIVTPTALLLFEMNNA